MDRGHVKLWRKSFDSGIIQNPNLWTFWTWCLLKATWKKRTVIINLQTVELEPGQFIFGRKVASSELKMGEQVIRTCLKKLKNMENLTIKTTNKYSIISIMNWEVYQQQQPATNQLSNQQLTNSQPATNQQLTTDKKERKKEVKESKELKDIPSTPLPCIPIINPEITNFVNQFQQWSLSEHGNLAEQLTESLITNCSDVVDKLIRIDGFSQNDIFNSIRWAAGDEFWSSQIRSLAGLRRKSPNGQSKFKNMFSDYQKKKNSTGSPRTDQNIKTADSWVDRKRKEMEANGQ